jgi:hypothetical protein
MSPRLRAGIGAGACVAFLITHVTGLSDASWVYALLLFAALVLVPLALELLRDETEREVTARWFLWLDRLQMPAALLLLVACWLAPGKAAALAALPWAALTGLLALIGIARLRHGGLRRDFDGLCRDAALIFSVIGGAWTIADRGGFRPLGFDPAIVALTAVHFHYAGILLPLFAGLVQRELFFLRLASRAALGVVLGVPAVAVGITATQLGAGASLEAGAGCGLALAGMVVGILQVRIATEARQPLLTRIALGIAGVSLFIGMVLAALYAMRAFVAPFPGLGIPQMRMLHGTLNALGFGLCGVLGWRMISRRPAK